MVSDIDIVSRSHCKDSSKKHEHVDKKAHVHD